MILRHLTNSSKIKSIVRDGALDAKYSRRVSSADRGYISFENYNNNDVLAKIYQYTHHNEEPIQLFFDADEMIRDGINLISPRKNWPSKAENKIFVCGNQITQEEYEKIGQYYFVQGRVDLKYLTDRSRYELERLMDKDN